MGDAMSWAEICRRYPDEWVCLLDTEDQPHGYVCVARVIAHAASIGQALAKIGAHPDAIVTHTGAPAEQSSRMEIIAAV